MSLIYSPKIPTDGLVLYVDAANHKSYPGEPTINLAPAGERTCESSFSRQGYYRQTWTYSQETNIENRNNITKIYIEPTTGDNPYADFGFAAYKDGGSQIGDVYTISFEYKTLQGNNNPSLHTSYANGYKLPDSSGAASFSSATITELQNGWYKYSITATITIAGNTWWRFGIYSNNIITEVLVDNFQVENKSHVTPFIDGERSHINGLKDLSKYQHSTNLSNANYDSDGKILYSGTNGITITNSSNLEITNNITLESWIYHTNRTPGGSNIDRSGIIIKPSGYYISIDTSGYLCFGFYKSSNGAFSGHTASNTIIPLNTWTHVASSFDGTYRRWYINGALDKEESLNDGILPRQRNVRIGYESDSYGRKFKGYIPIVKIYDRVLSGIEINQNFNSLKGRFSF